MEYLGPILAVLLILLAILAITLYRHRIKERKDFEKKVKELEALRLDRDRFISIISHELKGPLGAMILLAGQLREKHDALGREQLYHALDLMEDTARMTGELLENLLRWNMLQSGQVNCSRESLDLAEVVESTMRILIPEAERKQVRIRQEIPGGVVVEADRIMTGSIVRNLLTNALQAMDKPGEIRISSRDNGRETEVEISDEGKGIVPDELDRIMRGDIEQWMAGRPAMGSGRGLGLFLCREFAGMNGGWIRAQSEPGKGSIFTFALPKLQNA